LNIFCLSHISSKFIVCQAKIKNQVTFHFLISHVTTCCHSFKTPLEKSWAYLQNLASKPDINSIPCRPPLRWQRHADNHCGFRPMRTCDVTIIEIRELNLWFGSTGTQVRHSCKFKVCPWILLFIKLARYSQNTQISSLFCPELLPRSFNVSWAFIQVPVLSKCTYESLNLSWALIVDPSTCPSLSFGQYAFKMYSFI
jgi:hypothetical protein